MSLVFCAFCGNHDICPSEMGGNPTCDMCGQPGIMPCGKCEACTSDYYDDEEEEGEICPTCGGRDDNHGPACPDDDAIWY